MFKGTELKYIKKYGIERGQLFFKKYEEFKKNNKSRGYWLNNGVDMLIVNKKEIKKYLENNWKQGQLNK